MKQLFVTLVAMFVFSLNSAAFASESCPSGAMCDENHIMTGSMTAQPVAKTPIFANNSGAQKKAPEKKWGDYTPEEKAAYQKQVAEAKKRDGGKMVAFTKTMSVCSYGSAESSLVDWLIKFPNVVVDKKEYLAPAWKVTSISNYDGHAYTQCTATIVVRYHEKKWWKFWE